MKTRAILFGLFLIAGASIQASAQTQDTATSSEGKVGKTVNKVGNKTAQTAVKATSGVTDKKYDSKVGPDGQTVYINGKSEYYYVNPKGKRVFVKESELKDKPTK